MGRRGRDIPAEFREAVNMPAEELQRWLETDESRRVGQTKRGQSSSVGHQSGERIVKLLRAEGEPSEDDLAHMKKVISYVRRHLAQRPEGDVEHTRWRYSLMNWGHDPLR